MPLPVIGSVLLDGGQGCGYGPEEEGFTDVKEVFRAINKMPVGA